MAEDIIGKASPEEKAAFLADLDKRVEERRRATDARRAELAQAKHDLLKYREALRALRGQAAADSEEGEQS